MASSPKSPPKTPAEIEADLIGPAAYLIHSKAQMRYLDWLSSFLGHRNPFVHNVDKDDMVWLFDNTAYRNQVGEWEAQYVAAFFRKGSGKDLSDAVADLAEKLGLGEGDEAENTIAARLRPFADVIEPAKTVSVRIGQAGEFQLGPSGPNGVSSDKHTLPGSGYIDGKAVHPVAILQKDDPRQLKMTTHIAEPQGWAIVSDIDDTIKITMTSDGMGILKSTFVDDPKPVPGMPDLYRLIDSALSPTWFYLSASPYNLYPFLHDFRKEYYPSGTMILRDSSWMNIGGFISSLTVNTQEYKEDRLGRIYGWLPKRKCLMIGDSTQKDPEAYGTLARKHPGWIKGIFIHIVTGVDEEREKWLNSPERLASAFKGIDPAEVILKSFHDPAELNDVIATLKD
ncbi:hypothetical protein FGG08_006648 [Glutinoglossum americanum]|uniref:Phosphatidate phosphatase APP1 catalytic domain-containing protein n=1 Tax=Glutinoglossum americanum TaxID=1670608 RepID=A0A9P8HVU9_9PEZI|nr:hypothetical protein FGG08_006648 [Glutinoglossum americanum]